MTEKQEEKYYGAIGTASTSYTGFIAGQAGAMATVKDAAVTDATVDGMHHFLEMVQRVKNKDTRYRAGHLFEAIIAYKENTDAARRSGDIKTFITHLEKNNKAAADLERKVGQSVVSEAQAKFTVALGPGGTSRVVEELADAKYAGMDLYVPADRIERVREGLQARAAKMADPVDKARYLDAAKRLVEHKTKAREVLIAAKAPRLYAAQQEAIAAGKEVAFSAGTAAASAAIVGGAISTVKNVYLTSKGNITATEAAIAVAKDTGKSAGRGAITGGLGTGIRNTAYKMGSKALSKSNVATAVAAGAIDTGAAVLAYARGEIDGAVAVERIGQNGISTMSSIYVGAAAGAVFGPVGAIVGSMAGYLVASSLYSSTLALLRSGSLAIAEAERVEYLCAAAAHELNTQSAEVERYVNEYLSKQRKEFLDLLGRLRESKDAGDCESVILAISDLAHLLGIRLKFENYHEFDDFMVNSSGPLRL